MGCELIYCSIRDQIYEYIRMHGQYFIYDGFSVRRVSPGHIYSCIMQRSAVFLD